jgi:hypothetical protein
MVYARVIDSISLIFTPGELDLIEMALSQCNEEGSTDLRDDIMNAQVEAKKSDFDKFRSAYSHLWENDEK